MLNITKLVLNSTFKNNVSKRIQTTPICYFEINYISSSNVTILTNVIQKFNKQLIIGFLPLLLLNQIYSNLILKGNYLNVYINQLQLDFNLDTYISIVDLDFNQNNKKQISLSKDIYSVSYFSQDAERLKLLFDKSYNFKNIVIFDYY